MTLLRAVLGRFARFLVRIARRLDPGLAAASYWVMPEQMAALRVRYPGAPDSWLEIVARRTPIDDLLHSLPPEPEALASPPPRAPTFAIPARAPRELASDQHAPRKNRTAVRFPTIARSSRRLSPLEIHISGRRAVRVSASAAKRTRPAQPFARAPARHSIVNLIPPKAPVADRPTTRFPIGDPAGDRRDPFQDWQRDTAPQEYLTAFPGFEASEPHRPEWISQSEPTAPSDEDRLGSRWPEPRPASDRDVEWPGKRMVAARPDLHFSASANRWPDLPPLGEESSAPPPRADEAARTAEQIGGAWSG